MKKLSILLASSLFMLLSVGYYMLRDDDLNPLIVEFLEDKKTIDSETSDGFAFLVGILASSDETPLVVGNKQISLYRDDKKKNAKLIYTPNYEQYPTSKYLPLEDKKYLCLITELGCFENILSNVDRLEGFISNNKIILNRYKQFLAYKEYKGLIPEYFTMMNEEPINYINYANKVFQLEIIHLAINGETAKAINSLSDNIQMLREKLALADDLMMKLYLLVMIENNLKLMSKMYGNGYFGKVLDNTVLNSLKDITVNERSLRLPIKKIIQSMIGNLNKELILAESGWNNIVARYGITIFYKENMVKNGVAEPYVLMMKATELSPVEYVKRYDNLFSIKKNSNLGFNSSFGYISIRNIIGSLVIATAKPRFINLAEDFHILAMRMKLLRIRLQMPNDSINISAIELSGSADITNPYTGKMPYIDHEVSAICYTAPFKTTKVCMPLY